MTWLQRLFCACPAGHRACAPDGVEPPSASQAKPLVPSAEVPALSPARALEISLTDPEARGEWARTDESNSHGEYCSWATRYRNAGRDITLTRRTVIGGGPTITTPFTLSEAEKKVVAAALAAFDAREREDAERAALSRLTARGTSAGTAKTAKRVEGASPPARSRKGRAQTKPAGE